MPYQDAMSFLQNQVAAQQSAFLTQAAQMKAQAQSQSSTNPPTVSPNSYSPPSSNFSVSQATNPLDPNSTNLLNTNTIASSNLTTSPLNNGLPVNSVSSTVLNNSSSTNSATSTDYTTYLIIIGGAVAIYYLMK